MKVGDLVELSAAGKASKYYDTFIGCHGIVLEHKRSAWYVHWFKQGWSKVLVSRRNLKHVRVSK